MSFKPKKSLDSDFFIVIFNTNFAIYFFPEVEKDELLQAPCLFRIKESKEGNEYMREKKRKNDLLGLFRRGKNKK